MKEQYEYLWSKCLLIKRMLYDDKFLRYVLCFGNLMVNEKIAL